MAGSQERTNAGGFRPLDIARADEMAAEASVRRFLFSLNFDAPDAEPRPEPDRAVDDQEEETLPGPPEPVPLYTDADLETAREEARVLGHAQGLKDAEESALHFQVLATERIAEQIEAWRADAEASRAEAQKMAATLAIAVVEKLLPAQGRAHGLAEIEALISACIPHILDEPRLIVRVASEHVEAIRESMGSLARARGFDGTVVVNRDESLGPADCRLEWERGGAERNTAALLEKIKRIVARNCGDAAAEAEGTDDASVPPVSSAPDHD